MQGPGSGSFFFKNIFLVVFLNVEKAKREKRKSEGKSSSDKRKKKKK